MAPGTSKLKTADTAGQSTPVAGPMASPSPKQPTPPKMKTNGKKRQEGNFLEMARQKLSLPMVLPSPVPRPRPAGRPSVVPEITALFVRPWNSTGFNTSLSSSTASGSSTVSGGKGAAGSTLPFPPQQNSLSSSSNSGKVPVQAVKEEMAVNQSPKSSDKLEKGKKVKPLMTLEEARRALSLHNSPVITRPVLPAPAKKSAPIQAPPQAKTADTPGSRKEKAVAPAGVKVRGTASAPAAPIPLPFVSKPLPSTSPKKLIPALPAVTPTVKGQGSATTNGKEKIVSDVGSASGSGVIVIASPRVKRIRFADEVAVRRSNAATTAQARPPLKIASKLEWRR